MLLDGSILGVLLCCCVVAQLVGGETVAERMRRERVPHQGATNKPGATPDASVFDAINANDVEVRSVER